MPEAPAEVTLVTEVLMIPLLQDRIENGLHFNKNEGHQT